MVASFHIILLERHAKGSFVSPLFSIIIQRLTAEVQNPLSSLDLGLGRSFEEQEGAKRGSSGIRLQSLTCEWEGGIILA